MLSPFILYLYKIERKSSKEYSVVFVVEGENCPRGSPLVCSWRKDCPVPKHSRVSEVFKGFNVHDFEHYGQRNYDLNGNLVYVIRSVSFTIFFYVDVEKRLEDALRFETDVVLNILCLADFTCVD